MIASVAVLGLITAVVVLPLIGHATSQQIESIENYYGISLDKKQFSALEYPDTLDKDRFTLYGTTVIAFEEEGELVKEEITLANDHGTLKLYSGETSEKLTELEPIK